ncbi:MAG: hypothetical protein CMH36_07015 [Microbacterium sp.]|uniref:Uncharacterized protein n=2 Tax=Microbacterium ginsengisoli TaxID=400772 RepID=A0A0F0LSQ7_9MICO|nr:hypothetical protein [Microbacterium ginsengisoli]KJL36262.1 hypothetical protein RR49_01942 [Microbacterium ginsengisoli]MAL06561.1 hypothetical protein [Microbacterium sp.]MBN9208271.1 hypothetical protein [Microbacterium ginsengisoli]
MSDGRVAAVHLARSRAIDGALYVVTDAAAPAPFVVVPTAGAEAVLRARVRAGDSVVAVADFPGRDRILRRASAWGANAIWVGESSRPDDGLATVCVPGDPRELLADWAESAPRLAADPLAIAPAIVECTDEVCITCSDEGRLGEVVAAPEGLFEPARVRTADGLEDVDVTIVGQVLPGDLLVIHAGTAIALVAEPASLPPIGDPR